MPLVLVRAPAHAALHLLLPGLFLLSGVYDLTPIRLAGGVNTDNCLHLTSAQDALDVSPAHQVCRRARHAHASISPLLLTCRAPSSDATSARPARPPTSGVGPCAGTTPSLPWMYRIDLTHRVRTCAIQAVVAVGALESDEFRRQSAEFAAQLE